ncbi:MAG: hypothetical protein ACKN8Z_06020, partial [Polynucleobacter sp.]
IDVALCLFIKHLHVDVLPSVRNTTPLFLLINKLPDKGRLIDIVVFPTTICRHTNPTSNSTQRHDHQPF